MQLENGCILGAVADSLGMKPPVSLKPNLTRYANSAHRSIACRVLFCEERTKMRKTILFCFIVLLPALVVGISSVEVFPDSAWAAILMLAVTVGIAAIFTWQSGDATPKISRYCIAADFVIATILCVNLGCHWLLAREVSAAKQGVEERHSEEDREEKRSAAADDRQLKLIEAERRRLRALPREERRSVLSAPKSEPTAMVAAGKPTIARLTPEQVRESWWMRLTALAFAECFASVLAGAILAGIWEWDRNHDGIDDRLQQPVKLPVNVPITVIEPDFPDVLPTGKLPEVDGPKVRRR